MVIKKYIAKTEQEAVELAREELGKNVVIMNVKKNSPRGLAKIFRKESVEVTAAVDEVEDEKKADTPDFSRLQEVIGSEPEPAPDSKKAMVQAAKAALVEKKQVIAEKEEKEETIVETNAIEQKLSDLQSLLEKRINLPAQEAVSEEKPEDKQQDKTKAYLRLIRSQMENNEVEPGYVEQLLEEIEGSMKKDASLDNILSGVYQKIVLKMGRPHLIDLHAKKKKYVFFIGPTGVGKTTTIAKIASMLKLSKKVKVALVTSDTYRIAAVEQLKTYANILGVPLKVVYSSEEVEAIMEELEKYDLVLIDTAGRSHNNKEQREDLHRLLEVVPEQEREVFLVLSATTKYRDLVKISQSYSEITKYSLIFTKLDETDAIGNIFNIRMLTGAPLSYMTWGQNVPDDIGKADAQKMAKQLLGGDR
ncbi:MAG: flagellar biosynthesis protein FlhF [Lachnospiraceae bacterium]|nr:flagellar biosynthesis protein FlhF [Lachnospiraceae bacterium]